MRTNLKRALALAIMAPVYILAAVVMVPFLPFIALHAMWKWADDTLTDWNNERIGGRARAALAAVKADRAQPNHESEVGTPVALCVHGNALADCDHCVNGLRGDESEASR